MSGINLINWIKGLLNINKIQTKMSTTPISWLNTGFIYDIRQSIDNGDLSYFYVTDITLSTLTMVIFFIGSYTRY